MMRHVRVRGRNNLIYKTFHRGFVCYYEFFTGFTNKKIRRDKLTHLTQFLENARVFPHPSPLPKGEGTPVPFGGRVGDEGA